MSGQVGGDDRATPGGNEGAHDLDPRDVREPWPRPDTRDMGPEMMMAFIRARCPWAADHTHASLAPHPH